MKDKEELLKAIMELPNIETDNPISTMTSINVNDLMSAIDKLNKIPNYNDLLKENKILRENAEHNDKVVDKVNWENQLLKKENEQLQKELEEYKNPIRYFKYANKNVVDENKQLKNNWDKLRELILEEGFEINTREYGSLDVIDKNVILEKMQELEQGSDK